MSRAVLSILAIALVLGHHEAMTPVATPSSAPRTARERVRAELVREIKAVARRHLADQGAAALSLRAVARELGMVSSAIYRYFPSRDELLTAVIVDAYNDVGDAAEVADAAARLDGPAARWLAVCRAFRHWALDNPHQFALVYGSPVPGYRAPQDTVEPATRIGLVLTRQLADRRARVRLPAKLSVSPSVLHRDMLDFLRRTDLGVSEDVLVVGLWAWVHLIGAVTAEQFGHLHNVVDDLELFFDEQMTGIGRALGLS